MTARRPGDWPYSGRRARVQLALNKRLMRGDESLTDEDRALIATLPDTPRAKPVQHESAEMQALTVHVHRQWWAPGWYRWEAATMHRREAWRNAAEGVRPGWPDCGLFVPERFYRGKPWKEGRMGDLLHAGPTRALCELKAPHRRPKRGGKGGVTDEQRKTLDLMALCGFYVHVAYGADDALAWFTELAGPRPDVLPEGW